MTADYPILDAVDQLRHSQVHRTWEAAAAATSGEISTEMVTLRMEPAAMAGIVDKTILEMAAEIRLGRTPCSRTEFIGLAVTAVNGYQQVTGDRDALRTVTTTIAGKQRDYGHDNIARFGVLGLVVRLSDKAARLINLIGRGDAAVNESLADTWLDIAGYCVLALMWIDGTFLLPLAEDL
jgi:hypothetical protein